MKTKYYVLFIFLLTFLFSNAQDKPYYYHRGEKVFLTLDKKSLSISVLQNFRKPSLNNIGLRKYDLVNDNSSKIPSNIKYAQIEFENMPSDLEYAQKIAVIQNTENIRTVYPNFRGDNNQKIGLSDYLYVKLKNSNDSSLLQQKALEKNLIIVAKNQFMPLWYTLRCTRSTIGNSLQVANALFETNLFSSVIPDLLVDDFILSANDTDFESLWGLHNSANPTIDINACDAWTITEGHGVNVAVLDSGIELTHIDLVNNISRVSYDSESNTSPSTVYNSHGTHVAGIIGAEKDNNLQVVGVAPQSTLMSISNSLLGLPNSRKKRADGINWAWKNGADIINNSWSSGVKYDLIDDAIDNALLKGRNGLGTILVFAAGNSSRSSLSYPANSNKDILAVGAITSSGLRWQSSNVGPTLDVVAPGSNILSTILKNRIGSKNGTSMAAPHVAGVAALIISANPCLSGQQVRNIIEQTSQKVGGYPYTRSATHPNGTWNNEMGYGLVDAYAAVQMAQRMGSPTLDLYVKDAPDDNGTEPNKVTQHMWTSQDIWVRNNNDDGFAHQNPKYSANGSPNYIHVRVLNKSCVASTPADKLTVNWAKANTALVWPQNWDGSLQNSLGFDLGGELSPVSIPIIPPGREAIVKIPWVVPNPTNYSNNDNHWSFSLLSRINTKDDPLTSPFTTNPNVMVRNNNNLAWKNLTVVDLVSDKISAMVMISNPSNTPKTYFLELQKATNEGGKAIFEEAEVTLKMDDVLFDAWERGGKQAQLIRSKSEEKSKFVKGNNVILKNIMFEPNESGLLTLDFNFLTKKLTDKTTFRYHVVQKEANTRAVIGGETILIKKKSRSIFMANAGNDREIDANETITLSAKQINEAAIYNWYDTDGNFIYQGKDLTVSADATKKYKLEVVAETDGYKDDDEIRVKLKPSILENISPNPASHQMQVNYKLNGVRSAYLMIIGQYGTNSTSNNYVLNTTSRQTTINLSNYTRGFYTVALVCNGQIVGAKTLIKQ